MKYNPGNPWYLLFHRTSRMLKMYTTQSDDARVTAATSLLLQLLITSLHFAQLFTRLFPRASYLQLFVDSSAIDSGVTLGASNQPRQPRPQSTMHAQTRAFPLHLCKLAEAMSLIPSDATSPQGCSVSYSCSAPQEPEQTWCRAVIASCWLGTCTLGSLAQLWIQIRGPHFASLR